MTKTVWKYTWNTRTAMDIDLHTIKGPVWGTAPEANVFGGIKTPKKCI